MVTITSLILIMPLKLLVIFFFFWFDKEECFDIIYCSLIVRYCNAEAVSVATS